MSEPIPPFRRDDLAAHIRTLVLGGLTAALSVALPQMVENLPRAVSVCGFVVASALFVSSGLYALRGGQGALIRFGWLPHRFSPHQAHQFSPAQRRARARLSALVMFLFALWAVAAAALLTLG